MTLQKIQNELRSLANKEKEKVFLRFFKTGKGEYGEGDKFLGLDVPQQRKIASKYLDLSLSDLQILLNSYIHEFRVTALFILVNKYKKSDDKKTIFDFYIRNIKNINNWDLVDLSAPNIVGAYLLDKKRDVLFDLAKSDNLWAKRISIISTFELIKNKEYSDTFKIAELLLKDEHDLIHKATGWMLREVGKRIGEEIEEEFLKKHYKIMPRTMLRYAIERFPENKKKFYMKR